MKRIIISLLVLIFLSSCSPKAPATPNVTVTLKVTVTSMPTETPLPTFTPIFTPTPPVDPDQQAAYEKIAKYYDGVLDISIDGQILDAQGKIIEGFGYDLERKTLTRTYYSELLGREITEPIRGIVKYAEGKPTGEIDFPSCFYKDSVCTPEYAIDPATGKEVEGALKHSMFEVVLRQLEDMAKMTEQDKEISASLSYDELIKLVEPNDSFSDGQRYWVYKNADGVAHSWPLYDNSQMGSSEIHVNGVGIIDGTPFTVFGGSNDGRMGMAAWEVNGERVEVFIDDGGITEPAATVINGVHWAPGFHFQIDAEWLPAEFEITLFD